MPTPTEKAIAEREKLTQKRVKAEKLTRSSKAKPKSA